MGNGLGQQAVPWRKKFCSRLGWANTSPLWGWGAVLVGEWSTGQLFVDGVFRKDNAFLTIISLSNIVKRLGKIVETGEECVMGHGDRSFWVWGGCIQETR